MRTTAALTLLAGCASAQNGFERLSGWLLPGEFHDTPEAEQAVVAAGQHPNVTSVVNFTRASTDNGTPEMWSWRMNITDLAVPNRPSDLGMPMANNSMDLHVLNTQWQLGWPAAIGNSNQSLESFLAATGNVSVYMNTLRVSLPSNITTKYPDRSNGSCAPVLGDECTQSLMQAVAKGGPVSISDLESCAGTLDTGDVNSNGAFGPIAPVPTSSNNTRGRLYPGDTLYFSTSDPYAADNMTFFQEAESALYVLTLNFQSTEQQTQVVEPQAGGSTIVLCQRVDKTATSGTSGASGESGAARLSHGALWIAGIIGGMAAMWL